MTSNKGGTREDRFLKQAAYGWIAAAIVIYFIKWIIKQIVWLFMSPEDKVRIKKKLAEQRRSKQRTSYTDVTDMIKRII
jgi:hypothetical protein